MLKLAMPKDSREDTPAVRNYSYESLNEHLLRQSLSRSIERRDWRCVRRIICGWMANLIVFFGLVFTFSLYGCEIYAHMPSKVTGEELIFSWAVSLFQRFIVNEPCLILLAKGIPICFTSAFCESVCGESVASCLGTAVEAGLAFAKRFV